MSDRDKVSIVISTFNRPTSLTRAMEAAACQTYRNVEIIVVDNGRLEDTARSINRFRATHSDIDLKFIPQTDLGLGGSRNTGASNAAGDYIVFCDDDDVLFPNYVLEMHAALEQAGEAYGAALSDWIDEDNNKRWSYSKTGPSILVCPGNGWMFKRSVFYEKNLWYDDYFRYSEDFELGLRSRGKYKTVYLHMPLFKYSLPMQFFSLKKRSHGSHSAENYEYLMKVFKKNAGVIATLSDGDRAILERHAGLYAASIGKMKEARQHLKLSLRLRPDIKWMYYFATLLGWRGFLLFRYIVTHLKRRYTVWKTAPLVAKYKAVIPVG